MKLPFPSVLKKALASFLFVFSLSVVHAQCVLVFSVSVDVNGTINTTNNSMGADPSSYIWYVYDVINPGPFGAAEYLEQAFEMEYNPLFVTDYLVCLVAVESGTNNDCDSLCIPLSYTQSMMDSQNSNAITSLSSTSETEVYPNPATTELFLTGKGIHEGLEFHVIDLLGQEHEVSTTFLDDQLRFDVSTLTRGVYILQLGEEVQRFVVK